MALMRWISSLQAELPHSNHMMLPMRVISQRWWQREQAGRSLMMSRSGSVSSSKVGWKRLAQLSVAHAHP